MKRSSAWFNKDGLVVGYGTRSVDVNSPSAYSTLGSVNEIVMKLSDLTALGTDATVGTGIYAPQYFTNAAFIPANATVHEVRVTTDTAATSGGAATLAIGVYTISSSTGALVAVDADGLFAAADAALADFSVAGETITLGKAANAALVGKATVGAAPVVIAAIYGTNAFTAGALSVTVKYSIPLN